MESWDRFLGKKLQRTDVDIFLEESADVYSPDGKLLLKFRRDCLHAGTARSAFEVLRKIRQKTLNRGVATGSWAQIQPQYKKKDGTLSNTRAVDPDFGVESSVIGNFDRYIRTPFCRQTAWTMENRDKFLQVLPFLQDISSVYEREASDRFALQKAVNDETHSDWIIPGTQFTTVTVNRNWQTAVHTDAGDLKDGLSCITALRAGSYSGCELVFPHYRLGVDLRSCDLLMFDSHHMHGNLPLLGKLGGFERVSLVLYVREKMRKCLSVEGELDRAKNRKPGDPLW